jgi:hypothetical protein
VAEAGWYRLTWNSECAGELLIGGAGVSQSRWLPLVSGVHALATSPLSEKHCESGIGLSWQRFPGAGKRPVEAPSLTGPRIAEVDGARAEAMGEFAGYGSRVAVASGLSGLWDVDADARSGIGAVRNTEGVWSVLRYDVDGRELASWRLPGGQQPHGVRIAISPTGELALLSSPRIDWYDPNGRLLRSWTSTEAGLITDIDIDADGRLWATLFDSRRILVLGDPSGEASFGLAGIGDNHDSRPIGLSMDRGGRAFVICEQGLVQLLRVAWEERSLELDRFFRIPLPAPLDFVRIDVSEAGWFHLTTRPASSWRSYDSDGVRRMAASPEQSLFGSVIEGGSSVATLGEAVLVYDDASSTLWRMSP